MQRSRGRDYYQYPEAYVESQKSTSYMIVDLINKTYKINSKPLTRLSLGKVIYEQAFNIAVNIEKNKIKKYFAVRVPWKNNKSMLLLPNTDILLYEVQGVQTFFNAYEGDDLTPGDILAYVLTGKGEVRSVRVSEEATVFYIAWIPGTYPPKYVIILVRPNNLIILRESV